MATAYRSYSMKTELHKLLLKFQQLIKPQSGNSCTKVEAIRLTAPVKVVQTALTKFWQLNQR